MPDGTQTAPLYRRAPAPVPAALELHAQKEGAASGLRSELRDRTSVTDDELDLELIRLDDIADKIVAFVASLETDFAKLDGSRDIVARCGLGATIYRKRTYDTVGIAQTVAEAFAGELTAAADNYLTATTRARVSS